MKSFSAWRSAHPQLFFFFYSLVSAIIMAVPPTDSPFFTPFPLYRFLAVLLPHPFLNTTFGSNLSTVPFLWCFPGNIFFYFFVP